MMTIKNKNQYFSYIQKQFSKFAVVLVVASMLFGTLGINQTSAYFSDEAIISGNTFTAGTLEISLDNTNTFSSGLMYPGDNDNSVSVGISNTGTLNSKYLFKTIPTGSDNSACDYITVTATDSTNSTNTYTGTVSNFTSVAENTIGKTWKFDLKVNNNAPASVWDKTCFFKWTYTAWQDNLNDASTGFTSTKEKLGSIRIGKAVVLNEILADPNTTSLSPSNKEFVEIYNNSNVPIDLNGWQVSEMTAGGNETMHTIVQNGTNSSHIVAVGINTTIQPNDYLVLVFWGTQSYLNNDRDTVRLYDFGGINKLDEFSYPMAGQSIKPEGYSYARIPDGVGAWVDPIPTPGMPNELGDVIIPEVDTIEVITPDVQPETTDDATVTTDNDTTVDTGTDTTVDESEITATEEPATDTTTEDETATVDQPAQDTEDATAPVDEEDPAIESEATELESAVESEIASTEELVVEEIVSAEEPTDEISAESSNIQADETEAFSEVINNEVVNE